MAAILKRTFASSSASSSDAVPTEATELPHGRFIPENQRGWQIHKKERTKSSSRSRPTSASQPNSPEKPTPLSLAPAAHPDDLIYPDKYPWRPSSRDPNAEYIDPYHRNPTAKQAFYDTHFGSSSNYRGILSTSIMGNGGGGAPTPASQNTKSTNVLFRSLENASRFLPGARSTKERPERPGPRPILNGGDELAAQQSGFNYGISLEDAVQVEAIVSRTETANADDCENRSPLPRLSDTDTEQQRKSPPAASLARLRETLSSAWSFLPSFSLRNSESTAMDPELIPSVKKDPGNPNYFKRMGGNVVILGGYRGSVLRDATTHEMLWIPIKVGVRLRKPTLEIGLSEQAEERSEQLVYPSDMVDRIGHLVDMGRRLKERCETSATVYTWGYDWRLSLGRSSARLVEFLEKLYAEQGRGAKVIAHSMGGLVALHALATCSDPRIFEGVVFASTPFQGTPNILGPFRFGDAALFNDTICSPRATFSFRSSFYLLPVDGACFQVPTATATEHGHGDEEEEEEEEEEDLRAYDFHDPATWDELGLTPCLEPRARARARARAATADKGPSMPENMQLDGGGGGGEEDKLAGAGAHDAEAWAYLERTLGEVREFHATLARGFDVARRGAYPPLALLTSGRTPSVRGAVVDSADAIRAGDYSRMSYAPGDGIITRRSATTLPGNWGDLLVHRDELAPVGHAHKLDRRPVRIDGTGIVESPHRHVTLLSDVDAVGKCLEIIRRANISRGRLAPPPS